MRHGSAPYFAEASLDDLLRVLIEAILDAGHETIAHRGRTLELIGILLQLENPRSRLSVTENRGQIFSCLGEFLWYMAGSNQLDFIAYYVPRYLKESRDKRTIHGAYGPRLFSLRGQINQVENTLAILRATPSSRRAVIQLFDGEDNQSANNPNLRNIDVPCTNSLQFFVRDGKLHLLVSMRSNDVFFGLPHDIFCFTMLQELFARALGIEVGIYRHFAGSLHLYDEHMTSAKQFLKEGWQSPAPMPPMPVGDYRHALEKLLSAESQLRIAGHTDVCFLGESEAYWQDLVLLLKAFSLYRRRSATGYAELCAHLTHRDFAIYVHQKERSVAEEGLGPQ